MRIGQTSAIDFGSKVVASLLGALGTLYFARVLGADTLGSYFLILSLVGWLNLLGTMGIGGGLIKRVSEGVDRGRYLSAGIVLMSGLLLLIILVLLPLKGEINAYIGRPSFRYVLVLLFVGLAGSFVDSALQGQRSVHIYALLKPVRRAFRTVIQVAVVLAGFGIGGLVAGYAVGGVIAVLIGLVFLKIELVYPQRRQFESLVQYAKYAWLGKLKSQTFNRADILVLGFFVSPTLVGVYSIAWNIAGFLSIFSSSISSALFPEVSNMSSNADARSSANLITTALSYAGLITIPGLFGGAILGYDILHLYGPEFGRGWLILVLLIGASAVHDYQNVVVNSLSAVNRPDLAFRVNAVLVGVNVVLNVVLIYEFGWMGAAVATLVSVIMSLGLGYYLLRELLDIQFPVNEVGTQVLAATVMAGAILVGSRVLRLSDVSIGRWYIVILLAASGAGLYVACLLLLSAQFRSTIYDNLSPVIGWG